ncbi:DUF3263 domain-containing protein [Nocardioides sp. SOB77]|uniref:DUF3263 domain-containing protein n=1 Tax=Nocardioides oceani TaxID=3058369 RepID=A0ABT8FJ53_9ACTN|nr:DUF3263 domain-containing protein [Nocardioides oceani]MDN4174712.1 DUF3263 domain-containing protein [Nocardioides oceani]
MTDTPAGQPPLTRRDLELLEFERLRFKHQGRKESAALERFNLTPPAYYRRVQWVLDHPDALAYDAQLVRRLRAVRDGRRAARSARTRHDAQEATR